MSGKTCVVSAGATGGGSSSGASSSGVGGNGSLSCGAGTVLSSGHCVVDTSGCAAGTVLTAGVCQLASTVCAAGSTFDTGTKTCVATISGCGANTQAVSGVCQAVVRLSVIDYQDISGSTYPSYDWYMLRFSDFAVIEVSGDSSRLSLAIKVGTTGSFGASGLVSTDLVAGEEYIPLLVPAGQPLATTTPGLQLLPQTYSFPLDFPTMNLVSGVPGLGGFAGFVPVPGDQLLVSYPTAASFVLHVPLPAGELTASQSLMALAVTNNGGPAAASLGFIPTATHLQDSFGFEPYLASWAVSHGHLVAAGDALSIQTNGNVNTVINISAASAAMTMTPGLRYVCIPQGGSPTTVPCFDDIAHATATTPDSYKILTVADLSGDLRVPRVVVNAFGSDIRLKQKGPSSNVGMRWGTGNFATLGKQAIQLYAGTQIDLDIDSTADVRLNQSAFTLPAASHEPSFIVVAPKVSDPSKPDAVVIGERPQPLTAGDTLYTIVNGGAASASVNLGGAAAPPPPRHCRCRGES